MTYLIVGSQGMLGRAFRELLTSEQRPFEGVDLAELDITDEAAVNDYLARPYAAVINCAAFANVDAAETEEDTANRVNGDAVRHLAQSCAQRNVPLVHYSTDYVFSGDGRTPYPIDGEHDPVNAYGRSKALGERAIWAAKGPHLLLRTSWLYAPWANNFVRTIYRASRQRPILQVVDDQYGRPTSAEHLARSTLKLLDLKATGTLHVTDGGECSWCDFAREIVRLSGHACRVEACGSSSYPRPAKRPAYSVMDLGPTEALLGAMPAWQANLADVMARLEPFPED